MIIGEAIKNIPEELRASGPEICWRDISRFRDRVVHHYFATDLGRRLGSRDYSLAAPDLAG
jgi:uncharacterized protein with HEPN domain